MNNIALISALVLGIGGSMHCLGMCGPLLLSLPMAAADRFSQWRMAAYLLAKALAYGLLGLVPGLLGKGMIGMNWQQALSAGAGLLMILLVTIPALKRKKGSFLFARQFGVLHSRLLQQPRWTDYLLLGLLNGLLPCGLVYTALAAATLSGGPLGGFLAMFFFGLGTIPALLLLALFRTRLTPVLRLRLGHWSRIITIAVGVLLVLRGLNLGIPYISPEFKGTKIKSCCRH